MRRKWIVAGVASLAAGAGAAVTATTVFGGGGEPRADVAVVDVKMQAAESPSSQRAKARKPTVIYLTGEPSTVDSAQLGPNMDIRLFSCPSNARVVEGGIEASDLTVDVQGSYVGENRREYHVLIQDEDTPGPFTLASHLTCLKAKSQG